MKLVATLFAPLLLTGCVSLATAAALVDVSVIDRSTGERLDVYRHRGRLYVAGIPGNRYAVSLHNKSGARVLTVVSVDGINAISGQAAAAAQSGYVLSPWQTAQVSGWRKSMDEVAAFYFTSIDDSYAARTDRPQHVGVIGVAVFREAEPPRPMPSINESERSRAADQAGASAAAPIRSESLNKQAESKIGTGHGERIDAPTRYTDFRRASSTPAEVITIYYDSRANLMAQGIIGALPRYAGPNPFPVASHPTQDTEPADGNRARGNDLAQWPGDCGPGRDASCIGENACSPDPMLHCSMPASSNLRSILAMLLAVAFFSLMDAVMKTLGANYPPIQVAAMRGLSALPLVCLYVLWRREAHLLLRVRWPLHLLRGVIGVLMLSLFAFAIRELALAEAYTIFFIAPLLITILSIPILKERVRPAHWIAIAVGMLGVVVAMRPNQDALFSLGALAVLAAASCYAVSAIAGRVLSRTDASVSLVFWTTSLMATGAGVLALPGWVSIAPSHWILVLALATTGFLGQLAITEAFRHGQASVVAPFEYTALAWGVALDWALWRTVPDHYTLLGGAIIIASGLYLIRQEQGKTVSIPP